MRAPNLSSKTPDKPGSDASAFHPLYRQIKDRLMQRITNGEWAPGTLIPSEAALAQHYGVSVGTLRKAFNELENENAVIRQQGRGTVVATHDADRALFRFFNLGRRDGQRVLPVSRVLGCTVRRAIAEERAALQLKAGARALEIVRVRELDGAPVVLERVLLDTQRFAGLDKQPSLLPNTLYHLYQQRFGVTVAHADERVTAVPADTDDAAQLRVPIGTPLLQVRRIASDFNGTPVELRISRVLTTQHAYFNRL